VRRSAIVVLATLMVACGSGGAAPLASGAPPSPVPASPAASPVQAIVLSGTNSKVTDPIEIPPGNYRVSWQATDTGAYGTVMDRLSEIKVPTLVMAGRNDFLFPPEHQVELAAGIPNARLRIIERAGHNVLSERPAEVMEAVRDFISAGAGVLPTAGSPVSG
jgi:pimeloyl-ACP methyl ester carboxylesterase